MRSCFLILSLCAAVGAVAAGLSADREAHALAARARAHDAETAARQARVRYDLERLREARPLSALAGGGVLCWE